jgi:hypothetical protein
MSFAETYIEKNKLQNLLYGTLDSNARFFIVIPAYREPFIEHTLNYLASTYPINDKTEVIIVVNHPEGSSNEVISSNSRTVGIIKEINQRSNNTNLRFHAIQLKNIPNKLAGVGYARKTGMDQVVLACNETNNDEAILISLDADCLVQKNYLQEIQRFYNANPKFVGSNIYFEHINSYKDSGLHEAGMLYEIYLRYYKQSVSFTGFPYAYHTIGSCFSCTASRYVKQGGMGKQQGGEDFYFLNKLFPTGQFGEINTTCVYPFARQSDRVPFGTGPAISRHNKDGSLHSIYNFELFKILAVFFEQFPTFFDSPEINHNIDTSLHEFLNEINFQNSIYEAKQNTSNKTAFTKRLFNTFNGFQIVKFVNYASEKTHPKQNVINEVNKLFHEKGLSPSLELDDMLRKLRKLDNPKI